MLLLLKKNTVLSYSLKGGIVGGSPPPTPPLCTTLQTFINAVPQTPIEKCMLAFQKITMPGTIELKTGEPIGNTPIIIPGAIPWQDILIPSRSISTITSSNLTAKNTSGDITTSLNTVIT